MIVKEYSWALLYNRGREFDDMINYFDDDGYLRYLHNRYASEEEALLALDTFISNAGEEWWTDEKFILECTYKFSRNCENDQPIHSTGV